MSATSHRLALRGVPLVKHPKASLRRWWRMGVISPRIQALIKGAMVFLTPPEPTPHKRAAAAAQANQALHLAIKNILRAGIAEGSECDAIRRIMELQSIIEGEAVAILAIAETDTKGAGNV